MFTDAKNNRNVKNKGRRVVQKQKIQIMGGFPKLTLASLLIRSRSNPKYRMFARKDISVYYESGFNSMFHKK